MARRCDKFQPEPFQIVIGVAERVELKFTCIAGSGIDLPDGEPEADIQYSNYQMFGNIPFPMKIVIRRPIENYSLEMNIEKLNLNKPVDPETFTLKRPDGVDDVDLNTGKEIKPK
jgi:hypothetical protein